MHAYSQKGVPASHQSREGMTNELLQVVGAQAQSYGCKGEVNWLEDTWYPPTVNDPRAFEFMMDVGARCAYIIFKQHRLPGLTAGRY